jgi:GNAT superfamily N-acetyltransferase
MIRILGAKKEDARRIGLLRRRTLKEVNKYDYPKVFLDFLINKYSTKNIIHRMGEMEMFCAWDGKTLVGTIDLEKTADSKRNKVKGLFVKSSDVGKGVGTQLMDFIENYARSKGIRKIRLYSTKFAFNFYKKRGYHLRPSGYWRIGKSKVKDKVMEKKL